MVDSGFLHSTLPNESLQDFEQDQNSFEEGSLSTSGELSHFDYMLT